MFVISRSKSYCTCQFNYTALGIANETIKIKEIVPYSIRKLVPPLLLQCNDLESNDNTLQLHFLRDLIWAIASGLSKDVAGTTDRSSNHQMCSM